MKTVNLIGAGLIGQERLKAVAKLQARGHAVRVAHVHDPFQPAMTRLAGEYNFQPEGDLERMLARPCDLVIVACPHDVAADHACRALRAGHRVLLEKPVGRNLSETTRIAEAAQSGQGFFVGLNYRFMPGVSALVADWKARRFGHPISLRMEIGHGGKPGDEKSWKLDPIRCGGGALLDPGIHLLDLCQLMLDGTPVIRAVDFWSGFWKTGIEEEVHVMLRKENIAVSICVSVVRWRSQFEIFALGTDGYGQVSGRGRSYGRQYYRRGKRWGWQSAANQAASEELVVDDACEDSFADELAGCLGLDPTRESVANLDAGLSVMKLYEALRERARPAAST